MATEKKLNVPEEIQKDRSASPPGWPNMPGRSQEKEGHQDGKDADVTEQQRELEKTTRR